MIYLFEVTVYSALLYAVYLLVLKNRTAHNWNRTYLLLCASLPLVIPLIKIPAIGTDLPVNTAAMNLWLPEITVMTKNRAIAGSGINWGAVLITIYSLGMLLFLLRSVIQYISFRRFVARNKYEVVRNVKVMLSTKTGPGSFGNYIFLPDDTIDDAIFEHELAHIQLKHTNDILFLRLLQVFFWPNIVLYMISRELKIVHEFQADAYAVKNKDVYITTLLNDTFNTNRFALSHTFFYHPLKRRIMMLQRSPLSRKKLRMAMLKTSCLTAILLAGIVYLQSCKRQTADNKTTTSSKIIPNDSPAVMRATLQGKFDLSKAQSAPPTREHGILVYAYADKMPAAAYDLAVFFQKNLKYPETARRNGIEGRVIVRFIVDEAGNIVQPEIVKSPDSSLSAEAMRVIKLLPKWQPGKLKGKNVAVHFYLPILFSLENATNINGKVGYLNIEQNTDKGAFTITGSTGKPTNETVAIEITDLKQHLIYSRKITAQNGDINVPVSISGKGMFFVSVRSASFNKVFHVLTI